MSKSSKSERKDNRIQFLERENAKLKKKNEELSTQKVISLNEEQVKNFLDELTGRIEWSTNRIVDEQAKPVVITQESNSRNDGFSFVLKCLIGVPFFAIAIAIIYSLCTVWGEYWNTGLASRVALFVVALISFDCIVLGVEIFREKDRNYLVSLFSGLVSLVALIVALVK